MTDLLPRICDLMTLPTDVLVKARTRAGKGIYQGRYADVLRGWEAQMTRYRRYLATEVAASRLPHATAGALLELAGSEFWASFEPAAQTAVGEIQISRSPSVATPAGTIKKGHRFARTANPNVKPAIAAAQFVSTEPVYFPNGNISKFIPVEAVTPGAGANTLQVLGQSAAAGTSVDTFFDPNFVVAGVYTAGGSDGLDDPWIRMVAAASYSGQFAPTDSALIAGAFEMPRRVRRVALSFDSTRAISKLFVADTSWGSSTRLCSLVAQNLKARWLGFGGRVDVLPIKNKPVNLSGVITLQGAQYLDDIADITAKVSAAVKDYFDNRPNFWTFRNRALRGLIAQCDTRILTCSSALVLDSAGATLAEPDAQLSGSATYATHYLLTDDALNLTFAVPS